MARRWSGASASVYLFSLAFLAYFARHAVQLTFDSWRFGDMAQGVVAMPLWVPQLGFSGGLVILVIAVLDEFIIVASGRRPTYEKDPPATPEELVARVAEGGGI